MIKITRIRGRKAAPAGVKKTRFFGRPRASTRDQNRTLHGKPENGRNAENVDVVLVFTVYSAMADFLDKPKHEATARARRLQTRTEIAKPQTRKLRENRPNSLKNSQLHPLEDSGAKGKYLKKERI